VGAASANELEGCGPQYVCVEAQGEEKTLSSARTSCDMHRQITAASSNRVTEKEAQRMMEGWQRHECVKSTEPRDIL
jgi:hypothetical protein